VVKKFPCSQEWGASPPVVILDIERIEVNLYEKWGASPPEFLNAAGEERVNLYEKWGASPPDGGQVPVFRYDLHIKS
jgi:hypothetical protein